MTKRKAGFIIGLTGNLGAGKTTTAGLFAALGAKIIDADQITHQLIAPSGNCFKPVLKYFGRGILNQGQIDRKKLADTVFRDKKKLDKLIGMIYPSLFSKIKHEITECKKNNQLIIIDAAQLLESGLNQLTDIVVLVKANQALQIQRAMKRLKMSRAEIKRRLKLQMPVKDKIKYADIIIDNRAHLSQTKKQVEGIWQKLQQRNRVK